MWYACACLFAPAIWSMAIQWYICIVIFLRMKIHLAPIERTYERIDWVSVAAHWINQSTSRAHAFYSKMLCSSTAIVAVQLLTDCGLFYEMYDLMNFIYRIISCTNVYSAYLLSRWSLSCLLFGKRLLCVCSAYAEEIDEKKNVWFLFEIVECLTCSTRLARFWSLAFFFLSFFSDLSLFGYEKAWAPEHIVTESRRGEFSGFINASEQNDNNKIYKFHFRLSEFC